MSKVDILAPFLLSFEGGFVNDKDDKGGETNKGVTLNTWRKVGYDIDGDGDIDVDDLKRLSDHDVVTKVLKPHYWDAVKADDIESQAVANMLADWAYNSGPGTASKEVQKIVGAGVDGKIGPKTIELINKQNPKQLFMRLKTARLRFLVGIVQKYPSQEKFLDGWFRRVNSIEYYALHCNDGKTVLLK